MIELRLRIPLRLKTQEQRFLETYRGYELPPTVIPARTTLRVVDIFTSGVLVLDPSNLRALISHETCRLHSYEPRHRMTLS